MPDPTSARRRTPGRVPRSSLPNTQIRSPRQQVRRAAGRSARRPTSATSTVSPLARRPARAPGPDSGFALPGGARAPPRWCAALRPRSAARSGARARGRSRRRPRRSARCCPGCRRRSPGRAPPGSAATRWRAAPRTPLPDTGSASARTPSSGLPLRIRMPAPCEQRLELAPRRAAVALGQPDLVKLATARAQRLDHWPRSFDHG